jgi:hypothetical protein
VALAWVDDATDGEPVVDRPDPPSPPLLQALTASSPATTRPRNGGRRINTPSSTPTTAAIADITPPHRSGDVLLVYPTRWPDAVRRARTWSPEQQASRPDWQATPDPHATTTAGCRRPLVSSPTPFNPQHNRQ